jgi:predicted patatin/cPLA2 family phospholipase
MKLKIVVSDFHLGKGKILRDGTQNILEDFIYDREFAEFLAYYRTGPYADADKIFQNILSAIAQNFAFTQVKITHDDFQLHFGTSAIKTAFRVDRFA